MAREASLPPIFQQYAGLVRYIQQVNDHEWSSSCPACGGELHAGREWPDRCRWFDDDAARGGRAHGWCRKCGKVWWPDQQEGWQPPSPQEIESARRERERREQQRKESAERALELLRDRKLWIRYHDEMPAEGYREWERRGLGKWWVDFWQFGWCPEFSVWADGYEHRTPTLTIPLFDSSYEVVNVKHRLMQPARENDKYRYQLPGQGQPLFRCDPNMPIVGRHVYAIEGEIKAAVTFATLEDADISMVGLPGVSPGIDVINELCKAERVTLVMDPGSRVQTWEVVKKIGAGKCSVVIPAMKIDDGIVQTGMNKHEVMALLRNAKPCGKVLR